jgi:hypothetical protein
LIPPHSTLDAVPERLIGTLFRGHLIALALLGSCSKSAQGQQASWKTYVDTLHGYALDYSPAYQIREEFHTLWLTDGRLRTEVYIEDWTKPVTRGQDRWDLASLAADRAVASCMADGPDCSTSCKVRNVEDVPNSHGVRVVAVTRRRFDTCEHPDTALTIDPLYVVDLSGGGKYYLLILGSILDQPGVPIETVRSIVATIRRVGEQRR